MKVRIWYIVEDGGDGSAYPKFFKNSRDMRDYLQKMEEDGDYDLSEGGSYEDIEAEQYEWVE